MRPPGLFLLLVCFCLTLNAQTQAPKNEPSSSGPSMQDTAQWIVNKLMLTGYDRTSGNENHTYQAIRGNIDSCVLTYTAHYARENSVTHYATSWDETHTFHLGAITRVDASQEDVRFNGVSGGFDVFAFLSSQADKVTYANIEESFPTPGSGTHRPAALGRVTFFFDFANGQDNNGLSTRMQKALTHAHELCAGSYQDRNGKEPF